MRHSILIFVIFLNLSMNAQDVFNFPESQMEFDLIGTLMLKDGGLYSYRILFDENKGIASGFSYTDINGPDETKSKIDGTYNWEKNELSFKESEILYTKSNVDEERFCFIEVASKIDIDSKKADLKGNFVGYMPNNDTCATGKINLISLKAIEKKIKKVYKKVKNKKSVEQDVKDQLNPETFLNMLKPSVLEATEELTVFWNTESLLIEFWDDQREDGDRIEIRQNGVIILDNYELKKEKKRLNISLLPGKNRITIKAINEGFKPPNTAKVDLIDGDRRHQLVTLLNKSETTTISIVRKK